MATPSTRQGLIDYCLRKLGEPVVEVNVDPDQIEDRVDEAIQYFTHYHTDGIRRIYNAHVMTADDIANKYISISDDILYVVRVFPLGDIKNTSFDMFDASYQIMFDFLARGAGVGTVDMAYYEQMQQHLSLIDTKLNGTPQFEFSRYTGRLDLFGDIETNDIKVGDNIVYEAYTKVDPAGANTSSTIYNDMFIKEYTTSLIKQQWGMNLIKFEGMQLPGGVTMNGRQLYDDANQEVERLQERLRLEFEAPVDFFMG